MADLDIPADDRRRTHGPLAGGETVLEYDFALYDEAELRVRRTRGGTTTTLVLATDYTVAGVGAATGRTITLTAPAQAADVIQIDGLTSIERVGGYVNQGTFKASSINGELDRQTMILQEVQRDIADLVAAIAAIEDITGDLGGAVTAQAEAARDAAIAAQAAAAASASAAATSAGQAATTYDNFDDRFLGAKTNNPTLDNDGNALATGALYFNSAAGEMRVWSGSAWIAAYLPSGTAVDSFNSRTGAVSSVAGDYSAAEITNDSGVDGDFVDDALDALAADVATNAGDIAVAAALLAAIGTAASESQALAGTASRFIPASIMPGLLGKLMAVDTKTDNYTLVIGDLGKTLHMNAASAKQFTIPANASVAFATRSFISFLRYGAGDVTVKGATGVTINGVSAGTVTLSARYQVVTAYKIATNEWIIPNKTAS